MSESNQTIMLTPNLKGLIWGLLTGECFEDEQDCHTCGESLTKKTLHITQCGCLFHKACWEKEEETRKKNLVGKYEPCSHCHYKYDIYKWNAGEIEGGEELSYKDKMLEAFEKEGSLPYKCECGAYDGELCADDCSQQTNKGKEDEEEVYYIMSNYNLTAVESKPSLEEYEEESRVVVDGKTEITYKKIGSDEGGNEDEE